MLKKHEIRIYAVIGVLLFITIVSLCSNVNYITLNTMGK